MLAKGNADTKPLQTDFTSAFWAKALGKNIFDQFEAAASCIM